MKWSDGEDAVIKGGRECGRTYAEIAAMLPGRSEVACRVRGQKLHLAKRRDRAPAQRTSPRGDCEGHTTGQFYRHAPHVQAAIDRAKARADRMIAAGTDPRAARNEILQSHGYDVGLRPAGEAALRVLTSIKPEAAE